MEFASLSVKEQEKKAMEILTQYGEKPRIYRNGLCLVVPDKEQIEGLRRASRFLKAIKRINEKKKIFGIIKDQEKQLKEREDRGSCF